MFIGKFISVHKDFEKSAHMIVETIAITYLGILAKKGAIVIKLVQKVYIVGAHALGTVNEMSTSRNLPNLPVGCKIAAKRPPTSFPFPRPAFQAGTEDVADANATPRRYVGSYMVIC